MSESALSNPAPASFKLVSEDGQIFTVEGFYLPANSGLFRNMMSIPKSTPSPPALISAAAAMSALTISPKSTTARPSPLVVEIPAHSSVLHFFIELMKDRDLDLAPPRQIAALFPGGTAEPMVYVLAFGKLVYWLDSSHPLLFRGLRHFEAAFATDPWSVFVIATKCNDLLMAKRGIGKIALLQWESQLAQNPAVLSLQRLGTVPLAWLAAYWRAFAYGLETVGRRANNAYGKEFWDTVAEKMEGPVCDPTEVTT